MDLLVEGVTEGEKSGIQAKFEQGGDFIRC